MADTPPIPDPQLPKRTALRFFAAFWVLGFHALPRDASDGAWAAFWNRGWLGVTCFFVLSGFILTHTYGARGAALDRRAFRAARFARISPLYLFAMLFAVPQLVHIAGPIERGRLAGIVLSLLALLQSWFGSYVCVWNCPSWSLSDEAFFCALFPLLVPLVRARAGRAVLLALTVVGMALLVADAAGLGVPSVVAGSAESTLNPPARLPEFLLGLWIGGLCLARRPVWPRARLSAPRAASGGAALRSR